MDFAKLIKNANCKEAKQKALEGFKERQKQREKEFAAKAKSLEPSEQWYNRRYDI